MLSGRWREEWVLGMLGSKPYTTRIVVDPKPIRFQVGLFAFIVQQPNKLFVGFSHMMSDVPSAL